MKLIYVTEKYRDETHGAMGSFMHAETGENFHWEEISRLLLQCLDSGTEFQIRRATEEELAMIEATIAVDRAKATASFHTPEGLH